MNTTSASQYQTFDILEHLPIGIMVLRKGYEILFWNRCLEDWTCIPQHEATGANLLELYPHLNTNQYKNRLDNIFIGGPPVIFSSQLHRYILPSYMLDGNLRIQHTTVTSIPAANDHDYYALFVVEDMTELTDRIQAYRQLHDQAMDEIKMRRQAEEALRKVHDELEIHVEQRTEELRRLHQDNTRLLNAITSVLIGVDRDDVVILWNRAAEETFGIAESQALGKIFHELPLQWQWPVVDAAFLECYQIKSPVRLEDFRFKRPNNSEGFIGLSASPIYGDDDFMDGVQLLGRDITEKILMEAQLNQAQKLEAIGQLASGIAHEINTPTQYIGDNVQFLRESWQELSKVLSIYGNLLKTVEKQAGNIKELDEVNQELQDADLPYLCEEIPRALNQTLEGIERVSSIVSAMKEFAHPGAGEKNCVDLNRTIASTITVARNEWKYIADVQTDFDQQLPPVPCLAGEINQVILNMIINASHAIQEAIDKGLQQKGLIRISTARDHNCVVIKICDNGAGIPPDIQDRLFEAFFTTKPVGKGSGQGLAISHSVIVDKHQGQINVESELGKGTCFTLRLPLETNS